MKSNGNVIKKKISVSNANSVIPRHKCPPDCVFEQLRRLFGWKI
jgi:hypothetical protein